MAKGSPEEDWTRFNPQNTFIEFSQSQNRYRCNVHGNIFTTKQGAGNHSTTIHNVNLFGVQVEPKAKETKRLGENGPGPAGLPGPGTALKEGFDLTINADDSEDVKAMKRHILSKLQDKQEEAVALTQNISDQVMIETSREIVNSASSLVQDVDIMWLYFKTKRLFPKSYVFADFIRACIYYTLGNAFHVKVSIGYELEAIDPDMAAYVVKNMQEWDNLFKLKDDKTETPSTSEA